MRQELTGGWPRASQGLDVMEMDPLGQGYDTRASGPCASKSKGWGQSENCLKWLESVHGPLMHRSVTSSPACILTWLLLPTFIIYPYCFIHHLWKILQVCSWTICPPEAFPVSCQWHSTIGTPFQGLGQCLTVSQQCVGDQKSSGDWEIMPFVFHAHMMICCHLSVSCPCSKGSISMTSRPWLALG